MPGEPVYFETPEAMRRWFAEHAATEQELIVGFMKKGSGHPSVTWPESVDEALCFGWIDGVRHRIDDERYKIRFTPRKASSHWSAVNIKRIPILQAEGRMTAAGLAAFEKRTEAKSKQSAYEQDTVPELSAEDQALFRQNATAWEWFNKQPPGYRKQMLWRVVSAKQAATRARRLALLIRASEEGRRL